MMRTLEKAPWRTQSCVPRRVSLDARPPRIASVGMSADAARKSACATAALVYPT